MNNKFEGLGRLIGFMIIAIVWGFWQPEFMVADSQPWYTAWFTGSLLGAIAPFSWIMSLFTDCPVKLDNQSWWFGLCWWISFIATCLMLLATVFSLLAKKK